MKQRKLGKSGPKVSSLGYGCMGLSGVYGESSDSDGLDLLHRAVDLGINFFDTADVYGTGHNEGLVGKALGPVRDKLVLASKFGLPLGPGAPAVNGRPEYVGRAIDASLSRLGLDYLDLYYLHRVDPEVPIEDTVGAMAELVKQGKVRFLGLSEVSAATLRRAHQVHPITALQSEWSLWTRGIETEVVPTCDELGVGIVPFSPLGRGFLSGTIRSVPVDWRSSNPRFWPANLDANLRLVDLLEAEARIVHCNAAQLALAWLLHQGEHVVPIPGTRSQARLEENCHATEVRLKENQLTFLDVTFASGTAAGARYPAELEKMAGL